MELDALNKLEERIGKAIAHIEKLSEAKKELTEKNEEFQVRISELEKELKDKESTLLSLEKQSGQISEKVKEKVEVLLGRIENYEKSLT